MSSTFWVKRFSARAMTVAKNNSAAMVFNKSKFITIFSLLFMAWTPLTGAQPAGQFEAVIGALDKITARTTRLELPQDRQVEFGTLLITARACYTRPPEEPPETYIYLQIDDVLADGTEVRVFSGWMLASSPALSALEHAVYDVWAITCNTSSPDASLDN